MLCVILCACQPSTSAEEIFVMWLVNIAIRTLVARTISLESTALRLVARRAVRGQAQQLINVVFLDVHIFARIGQAMASRGTASDVISSWFAIRTRAVHSLRKMLENLAFWARMLVA
jgi:hypothetical protein